MSRWGEGRPPYKVTRKDTRIIRALVLSGNSQEEIARVMRMDPKTLRKHFRDVLDLEKPKANATVIANLYRQASKDDFRAVGAAAFIAKTQLGWREKSEVQHTGAVGSYDVSKLASLGDEELKAFESILTRIASDSAPVGGYPPGDRPAED